jgi:hypothetical protein
MQCDPETYSFPLGAGKACPAGTFVLSLDSGHCRWSDGLFAIHGYTRGEVVPTLELMRAHHHPEDRDPIRRLTHDLVARGGVGAIFHRLIDSSNREHHVVVFLETNSGHPGASADIRGLVIDLTVPMALETSRETAFAVAGAYANRATVEQAKGILMGHLQVTAEEAFNLLTGRSQNTNTKLALVASELVTAGVDGRLKEILDTWGIGRTEARFP